MRTRNRTRMLLLAACLFGLVLAGGANVPMGAAGARTVAATHALFRPESVPCPNCLFGMVGVAREETARLNVVSVSDGEVQPGPCRSGGEVQPGPCRQVELFFLDAEGRTLAHSSEMIAPGRAVSLDLNGDLLERIGSRAEVRAEVRLGLSPVAARPRVTLIGSVEVFDNETGRTFIWLDRILDDERR